MKKMVILILVLCFSWHLFADEAEAKATAKIVDESGNPISDVKVKFGYEHLKTLNPWDGRTTSKVEGITDSTGLFTASSKGLSLIAITAMMEGYYRSYKEYVFGKSASGKYQPWNPTIELVLRKKINPVPMFAKKAWVLPIPATDKPVGYDFLVGDWVKPYGKGETSDIIVLFKLEFDDAKDDVYKYSMKITAGRDNDGFYPIPKESIISESTFKLPFEAPEDGYQKGILFNVDSKRNIRTQEPDGEDFFIRIRTELDENGKVKRAIFGKLIFDKDNNCSLERPKDGTRCRISFTYYINPDGTRNIEYDSSKNLFIPPGANRNRFEYNDYNVGL